MEIIAISNKKMMFKKYIITFGNNYKMIDKNRENNTFYKKIYILDAIILRNRVVKDRKMLFVV